MLCMIIQEVRLEVARGMLGLSDYQAYHLDVSCKSGLVMNSIFLLRRISLFYLAQQRRGRRETRHQTTRSGSLLPIPSRNTTDTDPYLLFISSSALTISARNISIN